MADRSSNPQPSALPRLGRYELIAGIASGGMGAVMLGRLAAAGGFQRLFAIKVLHKHYAQDGEFMEMLLDEARIAARIHHPNVVSIQEIAEAEEHGYYLVMDYVEGFPLSDVIQKLAGVAWNQRWRIVNRVVLDALNGLYAAHSLVDDRGSPLDVVHRDVSPQNIIVGVEGVSRVTDFGIAKAAARISYTRQGELKGKVAYMAPEQAKGLGGVDARADLFSLGIVLWEALAGQRLFKGPNELETYQRVMTARVPSLLEVVQNLTPAIDTVVMRALDRDPARRFQTAREMAAALERAARANELLADSHEVGEWMVTAFASQLAERRSAIRNAANDTVISSGGMQLGEVLEAAMRESAQPITEPMGNVTRSIKGMVSSVPAPVARALSEDPLDGATTNLNMESAPSELRAAMAAFQASVPTSGGMPQPGFAAGAQQQWSNQAAPIVPIASSVQPVDEWALPDEVSTTEQPSVAAYRALATAQAQIEANARAQQLAEHQQQHAQPQLAQPTQPATMPQYSQQQQQPMQQGMQQQQQPMQQGMQQQPMQQHYAMQPGVQYGQYPQPGQGYAQQPAQPWQNGSTSNPGYISQPGPVSLPGEFPPRSRLTAILVAGSFMLLAFAALGFVLLR